MIHPLSLLYPDSLCFESAKCHAVSSGQKAYVGHERQTNECKQKNITRVSVVNMVTMTLLQ